MRDAFREQILAAGVLHGRLRWDESLTAEARLLAKPAVSQRVLWDGNDAAALRHQGIGGIAVRDGMLRLTLPARADSWPAGESPTGDYAAYGCLRAALTLPGEDLTAYNQLTLSVRPRCHGLHHPFMRLEWVNDGAEKIPDAYMREGFHDLNLKNHRWNDCVFEFPDLPRDKVTEIALTVTAYGQERCGADAYAFDVKDIYLRQVERPDVALGWQGNADTIAHASTGYLPDGPKVAVAQGQVERFQLVDADTGGTVLDVPAAPLANEKGVFSLLDFTACARGGWYRLQTARGVTAPFPIGPGAMDETVWKVLHFLYCERCGTPVAGGHPSCHQDCTAAHGGLTVSYSGGWHDAGDVSQQTLQTAEVAGALLDAADAARGDALLFGRLCEEARWGLDFVLKMRFGDGYRATSMGIRRWTNGLLGDFDDEQARVTNRSIDNWLMAAAEARAARFFTESDPDYACQLLRAAREDCDFARERFAAVGMEDCILFEHSYNASLSQYWAAACLASAQIALAGGGARYAQEAAEWAEKLLACQETGTGGAPLRGFYYRAPDRAAIVHFNHQAREHLFPQALWALCRALPDDPRRARWLGSLTLTGEYIKALFAHAAPYGMLPAGIHRLDEPDDRQTFPYLHLYCDYEAEREHYRRQLESGLPLGNRHVLRHFPVWFSFRGNTAVLLSMGRAAALCGRALSDPTLMDIARDQLYFIGGKNPFGQSLVYGAGSNFAQQCAALAGEMVGAIPVGIQTRADEDVPYWPMANNATYKEVWASAAGHWLALWGAVAG